MKSRFRLNKETTSLVLGLGISIALNWRSRQRDRARAVAMARRAAPGLPPPASAPMISVLVAAWNEAALLPDFIASFLALDYPERELVLCAGGSDGTLALAHQYAAQHDITVVTQVSGEGKQSALRRALPHCKGEIIVLTDADCALDAAGFNLLIAPIIAGEVVATSGRCQPFAARLDNPLIAYQAAVDLYVDGQRGEEARGLLGANCAVSRQALHETGDFADEVPTGTDYHLAQSLSRLDYPIRFIWDSCVHTEYAEDWVSHYRRQTRWLRNIFIHERELPLAGRRDTHRVLMTTVVGIIMLVAPLASIMTPRYARAFIIRLWLVGFIHALSARLRYLAFAADMKMLPWQPRAIPWLVPITLFDFYTWASGLLGLLSAAQRKRW